MEKELAKEDLLLKAVDTLLSVCDGARQQDGMGFNRYDSAFVREIVSSYPRSARALYKVIGKYRRQLATHGIEYSDISEPAKIISQSKPKLVDISDGKFVITFPYDPALVTAIKSEIQGVRWNPTIKCWSISATADKATVVAKFVKVHGFDFSEKAFDVASSAVVEHSQKVEASQATTSTFQVPVLSGILRPFQAAGVEYILNAKRTFVADEMGLGKTIEALATVEAAQAYPVVVVCPATLKRNWKNEIGKWLPISRSVILVSNGKAVDYHADVVIINYDILPKHLEGIKAINPQAVIFDESHYAKNGKAKRTIAAIALAKDVPYRLALTGTPVLNRPVELLSQLQLLGRLNDFGGFWNFAKRYCNAQKGRWGWDLSGAANLKELNEKLRGICFIRRNKSEVLKELPAKQRTGVLVELTNRPEYAAAESDVVGFIKDKAVNNQEFRTSIADLSVSEQKEKIAERADTAEQKALQAEQLVRIEALKQLAAEGKMKSVLEWIESFLETEQKLVVFATHQSVIKQIADAFNAPSITGATPLDRRQEYVDRFQNDPETRLLVCNIQAGGVGITLTAASNVAFVELGWTPAVHDQAEDRVHRIGQQDAVNAWYLLAENTIDEEIDDLLNQKRSIVTAATEGGEITETESILKELVKRLTKN